MFNRKVFFKVFLVFCLVIVTFLTAIGSAPPIPARKKRPIPKNVEVIPPYEKKECPDGSEKRCPVNILVEYEYDIGDDISMLSDIKNLVKDVGFVITNLPPDVWIKDIQLLIDNESIGIQLRLPVEIDLDLPNKIEKVVDIVEIDGKLRERRPDRGGILFVDNFEDIVSSININPSTLIRLKFTLYSTLGKTLSSPLEMVNTVAFLLKEESEYRVGFPTLDWEFKEYNGGVQLLYSGCECLLATLGSFNVIPYGKEKVKVRWTTLNEINNIGENVWCAQIQDNQFKEITKLNSELIPSKVILPNYGASYSLADYPYVNTNLKPGIQHCVLEDLDTSGQCMLHCDQIDTIIIDDGYDVSDTGLNQLQAKAIALCNKHKPNGVCLDQLLVPSK